MSKWEKERIDFAVTTYAGGTPNRSREDYFKGDIPWISSGEVNQSFINKTKEYITTLGLNSSSAKLIPKDAVLLAMYGATAGQVAKLKIQATANQAVLALIPDPQKLDKDFLYHLLNIEKDKILFFAQGSGQPNLSKGLIDRYIIAFPKSTIVQNKIAKILDTCDTVIEQTQTAIAKYKAIKQGMLHDLFTRGLDANGKLRPSYKLAPELYKESVLGMIPKEWFVPEEIGEIGNFKNGINKDKEAFGHGCLFVNIIDAYNEILLIEKLGRVRANSSEIEDYKLQKDDIIFVRSSVKPDGVGYNTIFNNSIYPVVFCGFMIRFRLFTQTKYYPLFLNYYFRSDYFRKSLIAKSTVSANTNINQNSLKELHTIRPSINEQRLITLIFIAMDNKIESEESLLSKYQSIKRGLMGDLLSGKKEV